MTNMNASRAELKARAKATLKGQYWKLLGVMLLVSLISSAVTGVVNVQNLFAEGSGFNTAAVSIGALVSIAVGLFVSVPFSLGLNRMYIRAAQGCRADTEELLYVYRSGNLLNAVLVNFLEGLFVFLWSLLFIIPGIVKAFSYFMIDFLLAENPALSQERAFEISKQVMRGNRGKAFVLGLSFIGWYLLSLLTFGIGVVFLAPYVQMTYAHFYLELKERAIDTGIILPEDNLYRV